MNKKALILWGGWDGHEPEQCARIFEKELFEKGYAVEVSDTLDSFLDAENLKQKDLVSLCWTMGEMTPEQSQSLREAVLAGTGYAGWHGGMGDAFRMDTEYQFMVGGQFVAHPGNIIDYTVDITKPDDPIVEGISSFNLNSEQYYMHVDPSNEVLATTTVVGSEDTPWVAGTVMPVIWKRPYGKGKIFYASFGHVTKDFDSPEAKEIVVRGMLWATR